MKLTKEIVEQTAAAFYEISIHAETLLGTIHKEIAIPGYKHLSFRSVDNEEVYFDGEDWDNERFAYGFSTECLYDAEALKTHIERRREAIRKANEAKIAANEAQKARHLEHQHAEYLRLKELFE